jgi:hypothetical protein
MKNRWLKLCDIAVDCFVLCWSHLWLDRTPWQRFCRLPAWLVWIAIFIFALVCERDENQEPEQEQL